MERQWKGVGEPGSREHWGAGSVNFRIYEDPHPSTNAMLLIFKFKLN